MRNEIFADYGYRFKSDEWLSYFATKDWYKPRYDDVTHLLTDIDKANIKVILNMKKKMEGREKEFTKEHESTFTPAG